MDIFFRTLGITIVILAVLMVSSCATTKSDQLARITYAVEPSSRVDSTSLTLPWAEPAAELAASKNELRFYFMSGERQVYSQSAAEKFGDSCLIVFPNGETMLIDGGMPNYAPLLIENLAKLGVDRIDYLVLSHMHDDHYGGLLASNGVIPLLDIGVLLWNGVYNSKETVERWFRDVVSTYEVNTQILSEGDLFKIGQVQVEVLFPEKEEVGNRHSVIGLNNTSLVLKVIFDDFTALFGGDLYTEGEYRLIDLHKNSLQADLVKANHHGRTTSNSKEWVEAIQPKIMVATLGNPVEQPTYGYYSREGARVFNDHLDGYVRVVTNGKRIDVTTSRERDSVFFRYFDELADSVQLEKNYL